MSALVVGWESGVVTRSNSLNRGAAQLPRPPAPAEARRSRLTGATASGTGRQGAPGRQVAAPRAAAAGTASLFCLLLFWSRVCVRQHGGGLCWCQRLRAV